MTTAAVAAYKSLHRLPFTKLVWGIANQIGVLEALLLEVIEDWCQNNATAGRGKYYHDDEWWTAATYQEWSKMYPCLGNARKLQRLLLKIEAEGYLISGQFLSGQWNQTKFYRPNPETVGQLIMNASQSAVTSRNQIVPKMDTPENESIHSEDDRVSTEEMMEHPLGEPSSMNRSGIRSTHQITPPTPQGGEVNEERKQPRNEIKEGRQKPPAPNINNSLIDTAVIEETKQSTVICEDQSSAGAAIQIVEYIATNPVDVAVTANPDEQFKNGRRFHPQKGTYMSKSSDPWMNGNNPIQVFKLWVHAQKLKNPKVVSQLPYVQSELKNNYELAEAWWDGFLADTQQRFETMERRLLSGGLPNEGELEELASVAPYADPVLTKSVIELAQNPQLSGSRSISSISAAPAPVLPQGAENPDCYQIYKAAESVADISPEEAAANIKKLREMMLSAGGKRVMPKIEQSKPKSVVEDLIADLEDPGIRFSVDVQARAQRFVGNDEEWCADFNDQGMIVAIYRF